MCQKEANLTHKTTRPPGHGGAEGEGQEGVCASSCARFQVTRRGSSGPSEADGGRAAGRRRQAGTTDAPPRSKQLSRSLPFASDSKASADAAV